MERELQRIYFRQKKRMAISMKTEQKYRQITTGGKTTYQLLRVYQSDKTAFRIKEGTTEIREGAFSGCEDLEILLVPETVKTAGKNFLSDCKMPRNGCL